MRWLFFVFLVANALVYALVNFGGGSSAIDPRSREINAAAQASPSAGIVAEWRLEA